MSNDDTATYAFVDDQSPRIAYGGQWFNEIGVDGAWNSSLSFANSSSSSATFNFTGNRVGVIGFVYFDDGAKAPISEYMVDDGSPSTFQPTKDQNGTEVTYFLSPLLADGDHTLILQLVSDGAPYFVDNIVYNVSAAKPSATSGASQPTIVTTIVQAPSSSPSTSGATSSGSSNLVGPIVGGVVGGITLIVCALLAFYFLYWKPTRQRAHYNYHATMTHDDWDADTKPLFLSSGAAARQSTLPYSGVATPYPPPPPSTRSVSVYSTRTEAQPIQFPSPEPSPPLDLPSRQNSYAQPQPLPDRTSSYSSSAPSAPTSSSSSRRTVLTLAGTQPLRIGPKNKKAVEAGLSDEPERPVQQHQDSGYRFDAAGPSGTQHEEEPHAAAAAVVPEELPPVYSES